MNYAALTLVTLAIAGSTNSESKSRSALRSLHLQYNHALVLKENCEINSAKAVLRSLSKRCKKYLDREPNNVTINLEEARTYHQLALCQKICSSSRDKYTSAQLDVLALPGCEKTLQLMPDNDEALLLSGELHLTNAQRKFWADDSSWSKDIELAEQSLQKRLKASPEFWEVYYLLGQASEFTGRHAKSVDVSIEAFKDACQFYTSASDKSFLLPKPTLALINTEDLLASEYSKRGDYSEAKREYYAAIESCKELALEPNHDGEAELSLATSLIGLAKIQTEQNETTDAEKTLNMSIAAFERAQLINSKAVGPIWQKGQAIYEMAMVDEKKGKRSEAIKKMIEADRAYVRDWKAKQSYLALTMWGAIAYKLGEFLDESKEKEMALFYFRRAHWAAKLFEKGVSPVLTDSKSIERRIATLISTMPEPSVAK